MVSKLSRLSQITLASVVLVQLFFLVTASSLFPHYWSTSPWPTWLPIYIALTLGALVIGRAIGFKLGDPLGLFPLTFVFFAMGFMATFLLFQAPFLRTPLNVPQGDATATAAFNVFAVSFGEELLFRWAVLGMMLVVARGPWSQLVAVVVSAGTWTGYHLAVLHDQFPALLVIFSLGLIFGAVYIATRKIGGIGATWGAHAGWNLAVVGLFALGVH